MLKTQELVSDFNRLKIFKFNRGQHEASMFKLNQIAPKVISGLKD